MWLPAGTFYVRRLALDPAAPVPPQVELALEAGAPFALEQLHFGWLQAEGHALVFATHRRLHAADTWPDAADVWPEFLPLVLTPPAGGGWRLWHHGDALILAAWDGRGPLPAAVLTRRTDGAGPAGREELLAEMQARLGEPPARLEEFTGPPEVSRPRAGLWVVRLAGRGGALSVPLDSARLETADVRDRALLDARRRQRRRSLWLWRGFAAAAAGVLLALVLEIALLGADGVLARQRQAVAERAEQVAVIEQARTLGARIDELAQRRFRPFEMLATLNAVRPAGLLFVRCVNPDHRSLEIEAQARDAGSVGAYEHALRALEVLETVEIRDVRLREGVTTFQLRAVFKAQAASGGGA